METSSKRAGYACVVLDTAAFIQKVPLARLARRFVTVPGVLAEIRDEATRAHVASLPFKVNTRQPSKEAMQHVLNFAKLTGDLASLSRVDLQVLALTYMLESEAHGTQHLRDKPLDGTLDYKRKTNRSSTSSPPPHAHVPPTDALCAGCGQRKALNEFSKTQLKKGSKKKCSTCVELAREQHESEQLKEKQVRKLQKKLAHEERMRKQAEAKRSNIAQPEVNNNDTNTTNNSDKADESAHKGDEEGKEKEGEGEELKGEVQTPDSCNADEGSDNGEVEKIDNSDDEWTNNDNDEEDDSWKEVPHTADSSKASQNSTSLRLAGWGSDWVTPEDGVADPQAPTLVSVEEAQESTLIGCMTGDFAMQNVLLQMGLRVVAPDGKLIKRVKQWALRCFGCFHVTRAMDKIFCPACGNDSLRRVAISVDAQGTIMCFLNPKYVISKRGTRFPIPKPKGGRAPKFITREEELPQWGKKDRRLAAGRNGAKNDSTSTHIDDFFRAKGRNEGQQAKVGYGKKNPNNARKRIGKKKKHREQHL